MKGTKFYKISDEVGVSEYAICSLIYYTILDIDGVEPLIRVKKNLSKAMLSRMFNLSYEDEGFDIDVFINLKFGYSAETVGALIQKNIVDTIAHSIGVSVNSINIVIETYVK